MRNIVLCILYLFLVPMGGFAQSEVIVLYPDTGHEQGTRNPEALQRLFPLKRHACGLYLIACRTGYDLWAEPMILLHAESFQKTCTCFRKNTYDFSKKHVRLLGKTRTCFRNLVIMFL